MSRNIEKESLNGEAEHRSHVPGYCTNHRAPLLMERRSRFFSSYFFRSRERGECRLQVPSEGRHLPAVMSTAT